MFMGSSELNSLWVFGVSYLFTGLAWAATSFVPSSIGISATLFAQCAANHFYALRRTAPGDESRRRAKQIQLTFICALFVAGTLNMAGLAWSNAVGTLDYAMYPGGPYAYSLMHFRNPMFMLGQIPFAITTWLADGFMVSTAVALSSGSEPTWMRFEVYRCYVVYAMMPIVWYILIIPLLAFFASIGLCSPPCLMKHGPLTSLIQVRESPSLSSPWHPTAAFSSSSTSQSQMLDSPPV